MMLFGKGIPVCGSVAGLLWRKKGFAGSSNSLKLPSRIARLGTVMVSVVSSRRRSHSSPQKKNRFFRSVLNFPGMKIGPPRLKPNWLYRQGAAFDSRGFPLLLRDQVLASIAEFWKTSVKVP